MNTEEAIKTAIEYEKRVRDTYADALTKVKDPKGKKVFEVLAKEEQGHVDYLESRLTVWRETGSLDPEGLETAIPSATRIKAHVAKLKKPLQKVDLSAELELLKRALQVEVETYGFYRKVVDELPPESRPLFDRFLQIEEGHKTIVQAEIDSVTGMGFWFDMPEFQLEAG